MKKLTSLILGLTATVGLAQENNTNATSIDHYDFTSIQTMMSNDTVIYAHHFNFKDYFKTKKKKNVLFYQDWKDFYDDSLLPLYLAVKEPIKFKNDAFTFEVVEMRHSSYGGGLTIDLEKLFAKKHKSRKKYYSHK